MKLDDTKPEDWPVLTFRYRKDCKCASADVRLDKSAGWIWRCAECDKPLVLVGAP